RLSWLAWWLWYCDSSAPYLPVIPGRVGLVTHRGDRQAQCGRGGGRHHRGGRLHGLDALITLGLLRPRVLLTLIRPHRGGALRISGDGQGRVHTGVRGHGGAVDHEEIRQAPHAVVGVHHPVVRGAGDRAATEEVGGQRDVNHLGPHATCQATLAQGGQDTGRLIALRDPARVRLAGALLGGQPGELAERARVRGQRVIAGLHH